MYLFNLDFNDIYTKIGTESNYINSQNDDFNILHIF